MTASWSPNSTNLHLYTSHHLLWEYLNVTSGQSLDMSHFSNNGCTSRSGSFNILSPFCKDLDPDQRLNGWKRWKRWQVLLWKENAFSSASWEISTFANIGKAITLFVLIQLISHVHCTMEHLVFPINLSHSLPPHSIHFHHPHTPGEPWGRCRPLHESPLLCHLPRPSCHLPLSDAQGKDGNDGDDNDDWEHGLSNNDDDGV